MNEKAEGCIRRVYFEKDYEYFKVRCQQTPVYLDILLELLRPKCKEVIVHNAENGPEISIWLKFDTYRSNDLCIEYLTVIKISKVSDLFVFQHEFCVESNDPDRMTTELDGFRGWAYTFSQYSLEEEATTFLKNFGLQKLGLNEVDEVIVGLEMPTQTIFGPQMTVENALFRDLYEICEM